MLTDLANTEYQRSTIQSLISFIESVPAYAIPKLAIADLQHPSSYQVVVTVLFFTSFKIMLTAIKNTKELPTRNLANIGLIIFFHQ
jgi:uncharacterized membrane protein YkvI